MSVRDRIEDSQLLFDAGRLEGALVSVLLAVASTARKRYPKSTGMNDGAAFVKFLEDERQKTLGGKEIRIEFRGESLSLERLLYKFVRNYLVHEAELEDHISFDYGDFLLDKKGTTDHFTFSSELVIRLSFVVSSVPENDGMFPEDRYERLPEPRSLKQTAIVKYQYGDEAFEVFCSACSVRTELWEETGEMETWLHLKGRQAFREQVVSGTGTIALLVPTKYITSIESGPEFQRSKKRTSIDIGLFVPDKQAAKNTMGLLAIKQAVAVRQIPVVETVTRSYRPHYETENDAGEPPAEARR